MILILILFKHIIAKKFICRNLTYQKMIYVDFSKMNKLLLIIAVKYSL